MAWVKGQSGNRLGRPKGKKDQFVQRFWKDLSDAWTASGTQALQTMIEHNPSKFVAICASVLPRDEQAREFSHSIEVTLREPEWLRLSDTQSQANKPQVIDMIKEDSDTSKP